MTFSYDLPSFGTGQSTGPSAQYPYPPNPSHAQQNHFPSSYTPSNFPKPASPPYPDLNLSQPTINAEFDTSAPAPQPLSAHDPSLYYDPRNATFLQDNTTFVSNDANSKPPQLDDEPGELLPTSHSFDITQETVDNKDSQNASDDELEEGELSEDGSHVSIQDTVSGRLPGSHQIESTDGAFDDLAQRSIANSQSLTRNLIIEMYSWGVTFEDMVREVDHPEQLRASFLEAGLPLTTQTEQIEPNLSGNSVGLGEAHPTQSGIEHMNPAMHHGAAVIPKSAPEAAKSTSVTGISMPPSVVEIETSVGNAENRPLDRKALIAQKLAAKSVIARASPGTDRSSIDISASTKKPPEFSNDSHTSYSKRQSAGSSGTSSDFEAQKKAQTELARRRMEALKQKMAGKEASNQASQPNQVQRAPPSNIATTPALNTDIEPPNSVPPRKSSYFSPVSRSQLFSIPGLMSAPNTFSDTETRLELEQESQTTSREDDHTKIEQPVGFESRRRSESPFHPEDKSKSSSRSENVTRPKRPEASDFIELPEPSKGSTQFNGDAGVIIDISDEESDQSGEDHTNEKSEALQTRQEGHYRHSPPSANVSRSSQPAAERQRQPLLSSTSVSGTPRAFLTPRVQEDEDLKSKELKIQSLTRKIAELEAKRHGKKEKMSQNAHPVAQEPLTSQTSTSHPSRNASLQRTEVIQEIGNASAVEQANASEQRITSPDRKFQQPPKGSQIQTYSDRDNEKGSMRASNVALEVEHSAKRTIDEPQAPGQISTEPHNSRRTEIENGIPLLDKEIERARQKLANLKQEQIELESEIQRGLDGKRLLMEELRRLLITNEELPTEAKHDNNNQVNTAASQDHKQEARNSAAQTRSPESRSDDLQALDHTNAQPLNSFHTRTQSQTPAWMFPNVYHTSPAPTESNPRLQNEDIIMDISQSEVEDGEVDEISDRSEDENQFSHSQEPSPRQENDQQTALKNPDEDPSAKGQLLVEPNHGDLKAGDLEQISNSGEEEEPLFDFDDEEMYEPEAIVNSDEPMELEHDGNDPLENTESPPKIAVYGNSSKEIDLSGRADDNHHQAENESQASEEEYEPPEPSEQVHEAADIDQGRSSLPSPEKIAQPIQDPGNNKPQEHVQPKRTYFTPYESPLKDFKSRNPQPGVP